METARGLANPPQLLLLDEVMDGLNPQKLAEVKRLIEDIRRCEITLFITKDVVFKPGKKNASKLAKYRLKDSYLRFYLKYLQPVKDKI